MADIKELLATGEAVEGQLLIERQIYDTLIEAVQKKLIASNLNAIYIGPNGIPGSSIDIDTVDKDSLAVATVAEGAAVPIETVNYSTMNVKPVKYGVRPLVTKEMQEDGKWDLMQHNIKVAGVEMAENLDSLVFTALASADNTVAGGAAITVANITRAMQYLEDADYTPTDMIIGPEVANDLRNIDTFTEAQKFGSKEMLSTGYIENIFGMDVHVESANIITSSKYAYIIDKGNAFVIAEKRPVTIEKYDDVTHDMSGAVITQRVAVKALRTAAICLITTS